MERIARGDERALSDLYDRYSRLVFSIAYGVVQNRETAEEVTLDIFVRVWEKAEIYDPHQARLSTWLGSMTRNRAIDQLRRAKVRLQHTAEWPDAGEELVAGGELPEAMAQLRSDQARVRTAIASLPADQRQALALAYFSGYSHAQIAQALDLPLGTVKGRIRAAMQKLRSLLDEE